MGAIGEGSMETAMELSRDAVSSCLFRCRTREWERSQAPWAPLPGHLVKHPAVVLGQSAGGKGIDSWAVRARPPWLAPSIAGVPRAVLPRVTVPPGGVNNN